MGQKGSCENNEFHVLGPPGTGKTTYLVRQVGRASGRFGGLPSVLVASLTKVAAKEIAGRVVDAQAGASGVFSGSGNRKAKEMWKALEGRVGTLHSLCFHSLGMKRSEVADSKFAMWNDWHGNRPELELLSRNESRASDPFSERGDAKSGNKVFESIGVKRARRLPVEMWTDEERFFYQHWCQFKDESCTHDFTDMIEEVLKLEMPPPEGTKVGFFDECQDFSRLELDLVQHWSRQLDHVVLAYDDDQSIYGFRGADPSVLVNRSVPADRIITLKQSYRVPRVIHDLSMSWIRRVAVRREKEYLPRDFDGRMSSCLSTPWDVGDAVDLIRRYSEAGNTVMCIATCAYQLTNIIKALRSNLITFHNPYQPENGAWNPLRSGNTSSGGRLMTFAKASPELFGEGAQLTVWTAEEMWNWAEPLNKHCFAGHGKKKALKDKAKAAPNDVVDERDFLSEECCRWALRGDLDAYQENITASKKDAFEYPLRLIKKDPKLLTEKPKVIVGTVHSVKGAEADAVILFPDVSPSAHQQMSMSRRWYDEMIRVFYVGMTRAKVALHRGVARGRMAISW